MRASSVIKSSSTLTLFASTRCTSSWAASMACFKASRSCGGTMPCQCRRSMPPPPASIAQLTSASIQFVQRTTISSFETWQCTRIAGVNHCVKRVSESWCSVWCFIQPYIIIQLDSSSPMDRTHISSMLSLLCNLHNWAVLTAACWLGVELGVMLRGSIRGRCMLSSWLKLIPCTCQTWNSCSKTRE